MSTRKKDASEEIEQPPVPLPKLQASLIPQIVNEQTPLQKREHWHAPLDEEFTDGLFVKDGEDYALCIHVADGYGRTHSCKNSLHFWQGTQEEFRVAFTKK